jgi:hypothetical protein
MHMHIQALQLLEGNVMALASSIYELSLQYQALQQLPKSQV